MVIGLQRGVKVIKRSVTIILFVVFLFSSHTLAADTDYINWQRAVLYLDRNNNVLLNAKESVTDAWKLYNYAAMNAENIDTLGMSISFMGNERYIVYDSGMRMLMTQQKEIIPEQMKLNWEMARNNSEITRNSMIIGLRSLYIGLYNADRDCDLKTRKFELQQNIHKQNKIKYQCGLISYIELAESEYYLLAAEATAKVSKRYLENTQRSFNAYLGVEPNIIYDKILFSESYEENRLKHLNYYLEMSANQRFEIVSKQKQLEILEKRKIIIDEFPLSMNIVSIRKDYEDLLNSIEQSSIYLEAERIAVEKGIKEAYIEVLNSEKNISSMKNMMDLQNSNLESMQARYDAGMISKIVLDQTKIAYEEIEIIYFNTLYDYNTKLMKLEYASGIGPAYQGG